MTAYLISFDEGAMTFPDEDLPDVSAAAHAVVRAAKDAGVWVFAGGITPRSEASLVGTDGTIADGPHPELPISLSGFTIVDVPTRADALAWAERIAVACRCTQEVREFMLDPEQ